MSLSAVLADLGRKEVVSVLIEGGGQLLGAALDAALVDRVQIYLGPIVIGGPVIAFAGRGAGRVIESVHLTKLAYTPIGQSICITGYPAVQEK